jgi:hypothetical protein
VNSHIFSFILAMFPCVIASNAGDHPQRQAAGNDLTLASFAGNPKHDT